MFAGRQARVRMSQVVITAPFGGDIKAGREPNVKMSMKRGDPSRFSS
jgi:hypothetical protein